MNARWMVAVLAVVMAWACGARAQGPGSQPVPTGLAADGDPLSETPEQRDARMGWWREARFGMFIHWGLYAIPAGRWGDETHHAEWIRDTARIPLERYDELLAEFNPVNFDARAWARMAREAGMRYIVITTKHHDGFCLWDSAVTEFDVMSTPFERDIIRELADAARAEGLQIGFYHSIMDWHHPDYLPRRGWEADRTAEGADFERYEEYLHAQVTELLTNYGPVGVMWFDGEWEETWTEERGRELYALCRRLQPDVIVNNRVAKGREGMAGLTRAGAFGGDFGTPEQEVPATGFPPGPDGSVVDWESCMTMNDHWGYNAFDHRWKSATELIRTLVDVASKGGNFLLNVGPRADGTFPPEAKERLWEIGNWNYVHRGSIHGTLASPTPWFAHGRCTYRPPDSEVGRSRLYVHVFDWPTDGRIRLEGLPSRITTAGVHSNALVNTTEPRQESFTSPLDVEQVGGNVTLTLRHPMPQSRWNAVPVVRIEIAGPIDAYGPPLISARASEFIDPHTVTLSHPRSTDDNPLDLRYTLDGSDPAATSPAYDGPLILADTTTIRVQAWRGQTPLSPIAERTFTRVTPLAAVTPANPQHALLHCAHYQGTWDRLPRFDTLEPAKDETTPGLTLDTRVRDEHFALVFTGYLYVQATGVYRFELTSDDGARLFFHDRLVIDNDGLHAAEAREGTIALEAGYQPVRVEYFNRTGARALRLRGEVVGREMVDIPARGFAVEGVAEE